jgi:hypothetical protein
MNATAAASAALQATRALPRAVSEMAAHGRPAALVYFGQAAGDDLLCTAVVDALVASGTAPVWMMSTRPDLFLHNPAVAHVVPYDEGLAYAMALLGVRRIRLRYHDYVPGEDRSLAPPEHIIRLMARRAGVEDRVHVVPRLYLAADEREQGRLAPQQIAIQSSARGAGMPIGNKEWGPDRFQSVVDALKGEFTFVQVGLPVDPVLAGAVDRRGVGIRPSAAIVASSTAFVGLVSFFMHVAKAVGTRSVIVYGGREHPSQSGYADNLNLFTAMECSPCWLWNRCPYDRDCLRRIAVSDVVAAIRQVVLR